MVVVVVASSTMSVVAGEVAASTVSVVALELAMEALLLHLYTQHNSIQAFCPTSPFHSQGSDK